MKDFSTKNNMKSDFKDLLMFFYEQKYINDNWGEDYIKESKFYKKIKSVNPDERHKYNQILCFFIAIRYNNITHISNSISELSLFFKNYQNKDLFEIWNELTYNTDEEQILYISNLIKPIQWDSYKSELNDKILYNFIIDHLIRTVPEGQLIMSELFSNLDIIEIAYLESLRYQSGYDFADKRMLVKGITKVLISALLHYSSDFKCLEIETHNTVFNIYLKLIGLFYKNLNLHIINSNSENFQNTNDNKKYDFILTRFNNENYDQLLTCLSEDGYCFIGNLSLDKKSLLQIIDRTSLQLICQEQSDEYHICLQNKKDNNTNFGYIQLYYISDDLYYLEDQIPLVIEEYADYLKLKVINHRIYQILDRIDIENSSNGIEFNKVFREEEEIDFSWFKVSDIFHEDEDQNLIWDCELSDDKVVEYLENKNFNFDLPSKFYFDSKTEEGNKINVSECANQLSFYKDNEGFKILCKDKKLLYKIFGPDKLELTTLEKQIKQVATQRVLNHPVCLSFFDTYFKVNASETNFISYHRFDYEIDGLSEFVTDCYVPYIIDPSFFDYCVMYLMHKHKKMIAMGGYILLPKNKKEQEKYYYKKQYEYLKKHPEEIVQRNNLTEKNLLSHSETFSIGFDNFRRFERLPQTVFKDITFFVGGNNSGKSTLVKGIILLIDNLRKMDTGNNIFSYPLFRFESKGLHNVNISLFSRALYNKAKEDTITFRVNLSIFDIELKTSGNKEMLQTSSPITSADIKDKQRDIHFHFDFVKNKMSLIIHNNEYVNDLSRSYNFVNENVLGTFMKSFIEDDLVRNDDTGILQSNYLSINDSIHTFEYIINCISIEYICAHAANQNILYNTADKNDYMAQTIHNFVSQNISPDSEEYILIKRWMEILNIGIDFKITNIAGEAYTLKTISSGGNEEYLADKGIGSNQMMILLLKIATIVKMYKASVIKPIIIIEEPEQNLHPALQSRLADLFYEINKKYKIHFIVETHSEYLIRRSQVIVSKEFNTTNGLENNPFIVYYFPESELPYDMKYTISGRFKEKFGEGFFDAASMLNLQLPRVERRR